MANSAKTLETIINPATVMSAVTLHVGDLENMSSYYSSIMSLEPIAEKSHGALTHRVLGRNGVPLLKLIGTPNLPPVDPRQAGLYHTAFLFETKGSLAATVYRAAQDSRSRFVGSADHLVSEAFYFTDPEGNGIELYVDRPRDQWRYTNNEVDMATNFLDPNVYLREHLDEGVLKNTHLDPVAIGHVHLQVGNIAQARDFYVAKIGFEAMLQSYPGALFTSAGGYHHHVAMNTWHSKGAGPRAAQLGLADVAVSVPKREDLELLISRLGDWEHSDNGTSLVTHDPWGTQLTISVAARGTAELLEN